MDLQLLLPSCGAALDSLTGSRSSSADDALLQLVLSANNVAALSHQSLTPLLAASADTSLQGPTSVAAFYDSVRQRAAAVIAHTVAAPAASTAGLTLHQLLLAGVASLQLFLQNNLTGPIQAVAPPSVISLHNPSAAVAPPGQTSSPYWPLASPASASQSAASAHGTSEDGAATGSHPSGSLKSINGTLTAAAEDADPFERYAKKELQVDGEDILGRCQQLQYLLLARILLVEPLLPVLHEAAIAGALGGVSNASCEAADDTQKLTDRISTLSMSVLEPSRSAAQAGDAVASAPAGVPVVSGDHHTPATATDTPATAAAQALLLQSPSWAWWALRVTSAQQALLAGRSATLLRHTNALSRRLLEWEAACSRGFSAAETDRGNGLAHGGHSIMSASADAGPQVGDGSTGLHQLGSAAWLLSPPLAGCLLIELALAQIAYGYVDLARRHLQTAGQRLGLSINLSGALGKRTVHQVDAKAQLVVQASRAQPTASATNDSSNASLNGSSAAVHGILATCAEAPAVVLREEDVASFGFGSEGEGARELAGLRDESEVFAAPQLEAREAGDLNGRYTGVEQALLLAWAALVKKGTAADELQVWEMAPYVEAVLQQPRSHYMLQAAARLLKARHERSRPRTRERALMRMEQLSDSISHHTDPAATAAAIPAHPNGVAMAASAPAHTAHSEVLDSAALVTTNSAGGMAAASGQHDDAAAASAPAADVATNAAMDAGVQIMSMEDAVAAQRLRLAYTLSFPLQVSLRQELAEQYVSLGFIGAALTIFEALELWDQLITCYRLLGKVHLADELIRRRLTVTPDDPRLWCALGDLHMEDAHYEEGWKRSGQRHTRSQRSLARSAVRRKEYGKAVVHYNLALALNPLYPDCWFSLGYAHMKLGQHTEALQAFTRVTQQEPDNGEAWNNVAALWLQLGRHKEAYSSLGEALRYKRDSWQMWDNYAQVALATGNNMQAARALKQVLDLTSGTRLKVETLRGLVETIAKPTAAVAGAGADSIPVIPETTEEEGHDDDLRLEGFAMGSDMPVLVGQGGLEEHVTSAVDARPHGEATATADAVAASSQRGRDQLASAVGALLKEVVNGPACTPEVWGLLAQFHGASGHIEAQKEALLKQVRGLQGTAFKSDEAKFRVMAEASLALCNTYMRMHCVTAATPGVGSDFTAQRIPTHSVDRATGSQAGSAGASPTENNNSLSRGRDLAAARMHLRGVLKQCEASFEGAPLYVKMQALLEEVLAMEAQR